MTSDNSGSVYHYYCENTVELLKLKYTWEEEISELLCAKGCSVTGDANLNIWKRNI